MLFRLLISLSTLMLLDELTLTSAGDPDVGKTPVELITSHGYRAEIHEVTTEDGYILTIFRIPRGKHPSSGVQEKRTPVLLVHPFLSSSADFLDTGNDSLGFYLADANYDVWLINSRGSTFSQKHKWLNARTQKAQFYNFSLDEQSYHDLPATIDYVLSKTREDTLHYVGFSQGVLTFLMMISERPEYNEKIRLASLMGPVYHFNHARLGFKIFCFIARLILKVVEMFINVYEFPGIAGPPIRQFGQIFCNQPLFDRVCGFIVAFRDPFNIKWRKMAAIVTNDPNNTSRKVGVQYIQFILNEQSASKYDYGEKRNLIAYNSKQPPAYNASKLIAPTAVYYGQNDLFVHIKDAYTLIKELPNVVVNYKVPYEKFNHLDFIFGENAAELVYSQLVKNMDKYNHSNDINYLS